MKKLFLLILLASLLVSCAGQSRKLDLSTPVVQQQSGMYALRILQQHRLRFSGILGVKKTEKGLDYVLLDASGVSLIAVSVDMDGQTAVKQAVKEMEEKGFVSYFSTVVHKIFQLSPDQLPCEGSFLHSFCLDGVEKTVRFGPFLNWSYTKDEIKENTSVYFQPFFGVTIELKPM